MITFSLVIFTLDSFSYLLNTSSIVMKKHLYFFQKSFRTEVAALEVEETGSFAFSTWGRRTMGGGLFAMFCLSLMYCPKFSIVV
mmetsp:Transcript_8931/g.14483  ORF Transcript_8931/g.14483 Transcript_8931/m.14483 type:complete len:84 (-) Transcript_8931:295-546(-)